MKKNIRYLLFFIGIKFLAIFSASALAFPCAYKTGLPPCEIASILGWMPTATNLCGGYYKEPNIVLSCASPPDLDSTNTTITADHTVSFSTTGTSSLEGNIIITQPGRKMTADRAFLYRDAENFEISQLELKGNVHYYESGKHLFAQHVFVDLKKKYARLDDVLYRLAKEGRCETLNAWGEAQSVVRYSDNNIQLTNGSYTTCPPISQTWKVVAGKLYINRDEGWGKAYNTVFLVRNTPLLWFPYFSFPVDKRRKSGWLFPTTGFSNRDGYHISLPYYLNLAPNYDAIIAPKYYNHRGLGVESSFRYITCRSSGNFYLEYIPHDHTFDHFRSTAAEVYGVTPLTTPFLHRLEHYSNSRGLLAFNHSETFNSHWWGCINLNYVTDDYYLQDFSYNPYMSTKDQLLNQAEINYASDCWRFIGRVQVYQTLHPINQIPILDQYARLPQLFLTTDFPNLPNQLDWQINGEYVNFERLDDFRTQLPMATGQRLHIQPQVSYPLITPYSFFNPRLQLDATFYDLNDTDCLPKHSSRILPIFDVDTGLYLERSFGCYTQTLEPRLFYLFVPNKNQNDIPVFDTTLPFFNFGQFFRTNRFVGYDRLGDANQVSFTLTSRFLESCTGRQRVRLSLGQLLYITPPNVSLTPIYNEDFYVHQTLSPFVVEVNYNFSPVLDGVADIALNPNDHGLNNASVQLHYHPDRKHIFNIGYDFVRKGDTLTTYALNSSQNNLNRINLATAWQLSDHWQFLGNWNYNLSHGHPEAFFYGVQYDSCCWALRFVASRIITAESVNDQATFENNYYVQLQLKGLGNLGNSDPGNLLTTSILGYQDTFRS